MKKLKERKREKESEGERGGTAIDENGRQNKREYPTKSKERREERVGVWKKGDNGKKGDSGEKGDGRKRKIGLKGLVEVITWYHYFIGF